ncbi:coproporphyrinogen III oxidase [Polymorphobacter arshaanensis]|uniref:Heme chaperone HemW n=1 Tax=Glacieibacterium arshaanense TaxID=2511025 RepID=A0A4Y9EKD3_9SPHN|nr:radical SAM family heme chaperone HemW [Polymorphobacter arshaanensis]TFU01211.1 coproporphyrinogen III oxidase [Polymorphobacter arshaanensis]
MPDLEPLAVYIHWPFCVSKCPYCDFNSHVRATIDEAGWRDALLADLAFEAALLPGRRVTSIFFGGGTPSLMDPATTGAVIDAVARHWSLDADCEITLEANPNSVEAARFAGYARAGFGRVSLGLQALDDAALKQLGRAHSVREGLAALDIAQAHFGRVSFDLIYDRPGQTRAAWEAELARALGFGTEHLSLYQLTIEPSTAFARLHADGKLVLPDADTSADLFELTQAMTAAAGLPAYEVSNHARPGAASRHNLAYWRYDDYIGVGPGAHGRRLATATERHKKPENWISALAATGSGLNVEAPLDAETRATEALLMGLRLAHGIDAAHFAARTGRTLEATIDTAARDRLVAQGMIEARTDRLQLTPQGRPVVNAVLAALHR